MEEKAKWIKAIWKSLSSTLEDWNTLVRVSIVHAPHSIDYVLWAEGKSGKALIRQYTNADLRANIKTPYMEALTPYLNSFQDHGFYVTIYLTQDGKIKEEIKYAR